MDSGLYMVDWLLWLEYKLLKPGTRKELLTNKWMVLQMDTDDLMEDSWDMWEDSLRHQNKYNNW